jgi:hypothetical protein
VISCIVHHDGFRRSYMSSADSSYYLSTSILHWKQNNKISMLLYRPCLCGHCCCTVHVYVVIAIVPSMFMWSLLLYRPCLCCHCYCTVHVYVVIAIVPSMFMWSLLLYRPCLCGHSYCTVHVYVVIHYCDRVWSFWVEATLCSSQLSIRSHWQLQVIATLVLFFPAFRIYLL